MPESIENVRADVCEHILVAPEHYLLTLSAPGIAREVRPGQFVMLRPSAGADPLLPRAFSVYNAEPQPGRISVLYRVVGRGTERLQLCAAGQPVQTWGPLGNRFSAPAGRRVALVGGGVGVPPLVFLAASLRGSDLDVTALIGASTSDFLIGVADLERAGAAVQTSTDDGSLGHHGYVTDLLARYLDRGDAAIYACGPMPMLAAVDRLVRERGRPAELALEAPMACGVGACLGCTVPRAGGGYARVCTDGPVFPSGAVGWD